MLTPWGRCTDGRSEAGSTAVFETWPEAEQAATVTSAGCDACRLALTWNHLTTLVIRVRDSVRCLRRIQRRAASVSVTLHKLGARFPKWTAVKVHAFSIAVCSCVLHHLTQSTLYQHDTPSRLHSTTAGCAASRKHFQHARISGLLKHPVHHIEVLGVIGCPGYHRDLSACTSGNRGV